MIAMVKLAYYVPSVSYMGSQTNAIHAAVVSEVSLLVQSNERN